MFKNQTIALLILQKIAILLNKAWGTFLKP